VRANAGKMDSRGIGRIQVRARSGHGFVIGGLSPRLAKENGSLREIAFDGVVNGSGSYDQIQYPEARSISLSLGERVTSFLASVIIFAYLTLPLTSKTAAELNSSGRTRVVSAMIRILSGSMYLDTATVVVRLDSLTSSYY
jgi:hypothetical protein